MSSKFAKKKWVGILCLVLALGIFVGLGRVHRAGADIDSAYAQLKLLADVFVIVERNYVEPVQVKDQRDVGDLGSAQQLYAARCL
jgi:hypothetical protein